MMADVHSKETRSYNMSMVKGKNTKPEMIVRRFLHANKFRYRLNVKGLPGKPDIVLPKYKTVILVHGCFWHGHIGCKKSTLPKTRHDWWKNKIDQNIRNDRQVINELESTGWRVLTIWECDLHKSVVFKTLENLMYKLKETQVEISSNAN